MSNKNSSSLISSIYKSRNILLKHMKNMGYNVENYEYFSSNEINSMFANNELDLLLEKVNETTNEKQKIYICYYLAKILKPNTLYNLIDELFDTTDESEKLSKSDVLYIIVSEQPNESLINELKDIWEREQIFIVVQELKRLEFNILEHDLVPKHIILSEEETTEIMKKYNLKDKTEFPEISRFDPVARAICLRPNQVVHIIRPSKTSILADYYRVCI